MIKAVENVGPCTLIHADWRSLLIPEPTAMWRALMVPRITAIVTDPPYGVGYVKGATGAASRPGGSVHRGDAPIVGDDEPFDPVPILCLGVEALLWGADRYRARLPEGGRFLAWDKLAGREPWDSFGDVDFAWHSVAGPSRIFSMLWKGVACEKSGEDNGKRYHPAQKPVRLMAWCLDQLRDPSVVFDPYMGSGSTAVAAVRSNIGRFIGCEVERRWFDVAVERVRREMEWSRA